MLLQMRALTAAARTICYATAVAMDISERATDAPCAMPRAPAPRC